MWPHIKMIMINSEKMYETGTHAPDLWHLKTHFTVKTRITEQVFGGFRLILFIFIGCFLQNQPENVLKVF